MTPLPEETNPADAVAASQCDGKTHLLLASTGSVATIKLKSIISGLAPHAKLSIRVVLTASAARFLTGETDEQPTLSQLRSLPNVDGAYLDEDEWGPRPWHRGANILHIALRRWADLLVVAPLSANTLAKLAGGLSDNLLLSIARAWNAEPRAESEGGRAGAGSGSGSGRRRRIVIAPAMNTYMYRHAFTAMHLRVLEEEFGGRDGWMDVLRPVSKGLACGDVGDGAMRPWEEIVGVIERELDLSRSQGSNAAGYTIP